MLEPVFEMIKIGILRNVCLYIVRCHMLICNEVSQDTACGPRTIQVLKHSFVNYLQNLDNPM